MLIDNAQYLSKFLASGCKKGYREAFLFMVAARYGTVTYCQVSA